MVQTNLKDGSKSLSWKTLFLMFLVILIFITSWKFWPDKAEEAVKQRVKPVKVIEVQEELSPVELEYLGTVQAKEIKQIGFKISGKLGNVPVVEGQSVSRGEVLAQLDTTDLELAVSAAKNTMKMAQSAYDFARDNYEKMNILQEEEALPAQGLDKARLEMEDRQASFNNAEIDYRNKLNMLDNSTLNADMDGIVIDVLYKTGEIVPAAYPVVILRGKELELSMGLSQNDLGLVRVGTPVKINAGGVICLGEVTSIGQVPDGQTKTYPTTIKLSETSLPLGMTVKITLELGEEKAVYIPINTIVNDGEDFVFVLDDNWVVHKSHSIRQD